MTCEPLNTPVRVPTLVTDLQFGDTVQHPGIGRIAVETVHVLPTSDVEVMFRKKMDGRAYLVTIVQGTELDVIA